MIRFFVRITALLFLAGAFVALILDGTRSIADGALAFTPGRTTVAAMFPKALPALQQMLEASSAPFLWDPVTEWIVSLPSFVLLALVGVLMWVVSRKRAEPIGYTSRP